MTPQQRVDAAARSIVQHLSTVIRNAGYADVEIGDSKHHPPQADIAQAGGVVHARTTDTLMTVYVAVVTPASNPVGIVTAETVSISLRDAVDTNLSAGSTTHVTKLPGIAANGVPQFIIQQQPFDSTVRATERALDQRREEKLRQTVIEVT